LFPHYGAVVDVDAAWEQEKLKTKKCPTMPQNPQRPMHALLGVFFDYVLLDFVKRARLVVNHVTCQSDSVNWVGD
jgi:hypothetical protein